MALLGLVGNTLSVLVLHSPGVDMKVVKIQLKRISWEVGTLQHVKIIELQRLFVCFKDMFERKRKKSLTHGALDNNESLYISIVQWLLH